MKQVFFVTEGVTDQIVLEGLIAEWLGTDFLSNHVQPPNAAYVETRETPLSQGWRGVVTWCTSQLPNIAASRAAVFNQADLLVLQVDGDVAFDSDFGGTSFPEAIPPVGPACDHVRNHLVAMLGGSIPPNVVLCIPAQSLEAWLVCSLLPATADANAPIEAHPEPEALLLGERRYKLVRRKDGRIRKIPAAYENHLPTIVREWANCTGGAVPRCAQALKFESEAQAVLSMP